MRRNLPLIIIPAVVGLVVLVVIILTLSRSGTQPDTAAVASQSRGSDRERIVASVPAPAPRPGPAASAPAPPEAPEPAPVVEPPPVVEVAPAVPVDAPGSVNLLVLENGTRTPLPKVRVTIAPETTPESPLETVQTDEKGSILLRAMAPGSYTVKMQWGFGPEADGGIFTVQPAEQANHMAEYPARVPFNFQLVDEEENPVAGQPLVVGLSLFEEAEPTANYTETVRTGADGTFTVLGYEGVRTHIVASSDAILFSAPRGRGGWGGGGPMGGGWSNPFVDFRALSATAEEPTRLVARLNQVKAIGRIQNPPEFEKGQGFHAMVMGRGIQQMVIPVNSDNEVHFVAPPGQEVTVSLYRTRYAWNGGQPTSASAAPQGWGGPGGPGGPGAQMMATAAATFGGMSREHVQAVQLPDEPGQFVFQMELQDRIPVQGIVYKPDGEPASGIEVIARGAAAGGDEGGGRGRGPMGDGRTMFRAKPTDADGRFQIELTQSPEYTFMVEQRTLPEDARTFDYPTLTWQEITEGEEVTLFLNYSGLVWGEVVDEAGGPMEGITVRLGGTGLSRAARGVTAISDANGIFELNVPIGNVGQTQEEAESEAPAMYVYATQRNSENPATGFSPAALNAEEMVRLIMYADTEVVARVTANGEPLTSVQVSARYSLPELAWMGGNGGGRGGRTISSENGVFSLGKFPRGVSTLTIRQPRAREGERVRINEDAGTLLDIVVDLSGEEFAPVARGEGDGREGRPDWEGRGPGGGGPPGGGPRGGPGGGGPPPGDRM